jgi:hypothetical protein
MRLRIPFPDRLRRVQPAGLLALAGGLVLGAAALPAEAQTAPAAAASAPAAAASAPAPAASAPAPAASAAAPAPSPAPAPAPPPLVLKDPHFGDNLFHFYQEQYFSSVTGLMVSQHFGRLSHHVDDAELLRGGLLLSYGLHREAGEIFAQLIDKGAAPAVRDRAWFYLAKIRYQRGFLPEAEEALGHIDRYLPPALDEERKLLNANLLMARGDFTSAAQVLRGLDATSEAGPYARYNLGVALIRSGDLKAGTELLDELGKTPMPGDELQSLRDQANVALGFAALQDNKPEGARRYLERVRLSGMMSNKALLGFGWAASALKLPKVALVPWTELAKRDASDAAVLEARIAVPFAYAEAGAYGQALERYNEAIAAFDAENTKLDESIAAIRQGRLLQGLLERNPGDEMGWFWNIGQLPEMPHNSHLAPLMARHEFQEAFKNYRDLRFLARNLQDWADNLGVFGDMLATRRQAYAERLPQVRARTREDRLTPLQAARDDLAAKLERVEVHADASAFADARQRDLLARLAAVRATLDAAPGDPELAAARERYRLAAGALTWEMAETFPQRLWEARKGMRSIDTQLDEARRRDAALEQAQRDEPARFEQFAQRIGTLGQRLQALIPRVAALSQEQQTAVQELAVAELVRQKERLADYTTQARFAVAQLYDRAHVTRPEK